MTGQERFGSYDSTGVRVAIELVNALVVEHAFGRSVPRPETFAAVRRILEVDPPSVARLRERDVARFVALARRLREIFDDLDRGDLDVAAGRLNDLLAAHPAHPHLAKDDGTWRLHHHPADAALIPMWTSICAEGVARVIGSGADGRLGICGSPLCDRVFLDESHNAIRRFCSTTCQNRVKAAAFRRRRAADAT